MSCRRRTSQLTSDFQVLLSCMDKIGSRTGIHGRAIPPGPAVPRPHAQRWGPTSQALASTGLEGRSNALAASFAHLTIALSGASQPGTTTQTTLKVDLPGYLGHGSLLPHKGSALTASIDQLCALHQYLQINRLASGQFLCYLIL